MADSIAAWLLTYALHSTVLIGGVWLAVRVAAPSERLQDLLWKAALLGALVTATGQVAGAGRPLALLELAPAPASPASAPASLPAAAPASAPAEALAAAPAAELSWTGWLLAAWAAGAALLLLRHAGRRVRLSMVLGERREVAAGELADTLRRLRARAGVRRPVRLTCSASVGSPVAIGRGEICVPPRALRGMDPREAESMLAHELAHLLRRDPLWLAAAAVVESVFFFQPLNRLARRGLQDVAEYLCDDWAAAQTGSGLTLARCLATVAGWGAGPRPLPLAGMAERPGSLAKRVQRLLDAPRQGGPGWGARLAVAAGALLLVGALAPGASARPALLAGPLPGAAAQECPAMRRVSVEGENDDLRASWSGGACRGTARLRGNVGFGPGFTTVERISPGGSLRLERVSRGTRHLLEARPGAGGRPVWTYRVGGRARALDAAGRAVLARTLTDFARATGYAADVRTAGILRAGGPAAVLAEVRSIPTPTVRASYLTALASTATLSAAQLSETLSTARERVSVPVEREGVIVALAQHQPLSDATVRLLTDAARSLEDEGRGRVLAALAVRGQRR